MFRSKPLLVSCSSISHNLDNRVSVMTFYSCFDGQGKVIARCQTIEEIDVLKRMGRPIAEVRKMRNEEAVVCSLTGSPSDYNLDY